MRTVPSWQAAARCRPSGRKATAWTLPTDSPAWSLLSLRSSLPVSTSQRRTVRSPAAPPDAGRLPYQDRAVPRHRGDLLAIGAKRHARNHVRGVVDEGKKAGVGLVLEVVPLPGPQGSRRFVEQLLDSPSVAGQPFSVGQGDV